jgi:ATP-binding cassette subfamily F protein 3
MDLVSKDILKQALQAYDGTLVIVSHDRDFLDGLVDKIYEFRDGKVKEHLGGVEDFLRRKRLENLNELERKADTSANSSSQSVSGGSSANTMSTGALSFQEQKERERERRKQQNKIDKCEKEVAELEAALKELEEKLSATVDGSDIEKLSVQYKETKEKLDLKMDEWLELTC